MARDIDWMSQAAMTFAERKAESLGKDSVGATTWAVRHVKPLATARCDGCDVLLATHRSDELGLCLCESSVEQLGLGPRQREPGLAGRGRGGHRGGVDHQVWRALRGEPHHSCSTRAYIYLHHSRPARLIL